MGKLLDFFRRPIVIELEQINCQAGDTVFMATRHILSAKARKETAAKLAEIAEARGVKFAVVDGVVFFVVSEPVDRTEMASRGLAQKCDLEPLESRIPCPCVRHNHIEKSTPLRVCSGPSPTCLARCPSVAAEGILPAELPPSSGREDSIPSEEQGP